jgi:hypothetical protein
MIMAADSARPCGAHAAHDSQRTVNDVIHKYNTNEKNGLEFFLIAFFPLESWTPEIHTRTGWICAWNFFLKIAQRFNALGSQTNESEVPLGVESQEVVVILREF